MDEIKEVENAKELLKEQLHELHAKYTDVLQIKKDRAAVIEESSDFFELKRSAEYKQLKAEVIFLEHFLAELHKIVGPKAEERPPEKLFDSCPNCGGYVSIITYECEGCGRKRGEDNE